MQGETKKLIESKEVEDLETHLTERIATLTENSLQVTATQRESLQNLAVQFEEFNKTREEDVAKMAESDELVKRL